jgi:DNA-binding response OmpR family regulator
MERLATPTSRAAPARVLIVDDQDDICQMLSQVLEPDGYETETAISGKGALEAVRAHLPDLILLDVSMPDMDGYEVASQLKSDPKTASIPIIMVSALAGRGARVIGLDSGAEDFLTKPVDTAELSLKVRNLLRLRGYSADIPASG